MWISMKRRLNSTFIDVDTGPDVNKQTVLWEFQKFKSESMFVCSFIDAHVLSITV